ncbi:MAG: SPOR domain-containing protein, partial [Saprospiraceae bacterium]|nr:SPOR domain-containing protein [Saprospiraceae bacterium]
LTAREVKDILIQTADKIGNSWEYRNGHSNKYGYGRVNAGRAITEALRRKSQIPSSGTSHGTSGTHPSSGLFEVSVNNNVTLGFGVQIGAFSDYDGVMLMVSDLERRYKQPVHVQAANSGGQTIYRVVVGSFATANEALPLQSELRRRGYPDAFIKNLKNV